MIFKSHVFDEPLLEFGDGGQHCDPRQGLREFGPLQPRSGDVVRVGIIGTEETATGFTEFLAETARGIESENKQLINLNPDFPGLGNQNPFRRKFVVPDGVFESDGGLPFSGDIASSSRRLPFCLPMSFMLDAGGRKWAGGGAGRARGVPGTGDVAGNQYDFRIFLLALLSLRPLEGRGRKRNEGEQDHSDAVEIGGSRQTDDGR